MTSRTFNRLTAAGEAISNYRHRALVTVMLSKGIDDGVEISVDDPV
jgi:hypothetical protein